MTKLRLRDFLTVAQQAQPRLPLTHITKAAHVRQILEDGELKTTPCKVLNEVLLYFFYGRAEYRGTGSMASDLEAERPFCFVVPDMSDKDIFATFPFDTGAFLLPQGIRERYFTHVKDVIELSIGDDIGSIQRLIGAFYGDNDGYLHNNPRLPNFDPLLDLEVASYVRLLSKRGVDSLDGRATTPEIAVHASIPLRRVSHVIAPLLVKDSSLFMRRCADFEMIPVFYRTSTPLRPGEFIGIIQDKLHGLF